MAEPIDYLDLLGRLTGGQAPGGLLHFGANSGPTGLISFGGSGGGGGLLPFGGSNGPVGLLPFGGSDGPVGLLPFGRGGDGGGLLPFGQGGDGGGSAFDVVKAMARPFDRAELAPRKPPAAAAATSPAQRAGTLGGEGVRGRLPSSVPATAQTLIHEAAQTAGLDPQLVAAVMAQESINFKPEVMAGQQHSPAGAIGPMQLMPDTARGLQVDPFDPRQNAIGGARYLADMIRAQGGDVTLGLVAYNGGQRAVDRYQQGRPFQETREYLAGVQRRQAEYQQAATAGAGPAANPGGTGNTVVGSPAATNSPFGGTPFRVSFGFDQPYGGAQFNSAIPNHRGVDIVPLTGGWTRQTPVSAVRGGTVSYIASDPNGGLGVMIRDEQGNYNAYFHLGAAAPGLAVGQRVAAGQQIAVGGGNADHLHLEVRRNANGDPAGQMIEPLSYFGLR